MFNPVCNINTMFNIYFLVLLTYFFLVADLIGARIMPTSLCSKLFFLRALTPVHAGAGHGGDVIDLPVQRDEFGFPCIWSSSLKGAVRSALERSLAGHSDKDCLKVVFGAQPRTLEVSQYSSHANLLDARLLFIPMRSLKGIWVYATSPHMVSYLTIYIESLQGAVPPSLRDVRAGVSSTKGIMVDGKHAVLNEEWVELEVNNKLVDSLFATILPGRLLDKVEKRGLVVLDDDIMKNLIGRSMLVQYRVMLSRTSKTVEAGPWTEEYLPEETILVSGVIGRPLDDKLLTKNRNLDCNFTLSVCDWLEEKISSLLGNRLWIGGKETLGRGLVEVYPA